MDAAELQAVPRVRHHERVGDAPLLRDLSSAGSAGSHQARLAEGLDTETRVVYGQPASEVAHAKALLGLSDTEARLLPNLSRGEALWKVGTRTRSFLVEHRLSQVELQLVDTDARARMR